MTRDKVAALVQARQAAMNRHDLRAASELFAEDCVVESPTAGGVVRGRTAEQDIAQAWFAGFPDVEFVTNDLVVDGDRVAWVLSARGTDTGGFMGLEPTRKPFELPMVVLTTFDGDSIRHERRIYDFTGMLVQIGLLKARAIEPLPPALASSSSDSAFAGSATLQPPSRSAVQALLHARHAAWIRRDAAGIGAQHTDDGIMDSHLAGRVQGPDAIARVYGAWWTAFPDAVYTSDDVLVDGEHVAEVGTLTGTDTGGFLGLAPTTKPFSLPCVWLFVLRAGQFAYARPIYDFTGLLVQIGVLKVKPV